jgi:hypothetical protein
MPSRWLCVAIVVFWLAANAWLLWRDVLPSLRTGQPPPFAIDFIDEVEMNHPADAAWKVFRDGVEIYRAVTKVAPHNEDESFELSCLVTVNASLVHDKDPGGKGLFHLKRFENKYSVARDGGLREMTTSAEGLLDVATFKGARVKFELSGQVRDGWLAFTHRTLVSLRGEGIDRDDPLEPVPLPPRSSVLAPLHPMNRIQNLRPGQFWNQLVIDLVSGGNVTSSGGPQRLLRAHVRPRPELLEWHGREMPCLVVVYEDDDTEVLTWVEQNSGLVYKQQVTYAREVPAQRETWTVERER